MTPGQPPARTKTRVLAPKQPLPGTGPAVGRDIPLAPFFTFYLITDLYEFNNTSGALLVASVDLGV